MNIAFKIRFILKSFIHFYTDYILNQGISGTFIVFSISLSHIWGWKTVKSLRNNWREGVLTAEMSASASKLPSKTYKK